MPSHIEDKIRYNHSPNAGDNYQA